MSIRNPILGALGLCAVASAGLALEDGTYAVRLSSLDGAQTVTVGSVDVLHDKYTLSMNDAVFTDHFLSMRPFKCLEMSGKLWCHVPYPYAIARDISDDLTDIEYDFLFVWKAAGDYGIDLWNGVYYLFDAAGVGRMHSIDLDALGVPPEDGDMRPISHADLHEAVAEDHLFPILELVPAQ